MVLGLHLEDVFKNFGQATGGAGEINVKRPDSLNHVGLGQKRNRGQVRPNKKVRALSFGKLYNNECIVREGVEKCFTI